MRTEKSYITETVSFPVYCSTTAAGIFSGFSVLINTDQGHTLKESCGTGMDRFLGAAFRLSIELSKLVLWAIDYDDGIFTYDHCEEAPGTNYQTSTSLPAFMLSNIPYVAWHEMAENNKMFDETVLLVLLTTWASKNGVEVNAFQGQ